ncbi:hypothetical protein EV421DRAFT_1745351 [Armillaria borealis]|uniref:Uncharacterized protein n=1 Tax=Armillaria borealis TaxID=47425 RepID=A0AA39MDD4_9AGAR|nr:hypothetical protein EV421DRAFT_1745351 [Armillaria borealis]
MSSLFYRRHEHFVSERSISLVSVKEDWAHHGWSVKEHRNPARGRVQTRSVTSHDGHAFSLFPTSSTIEEVTLEEEEPAFHPFPDAYHSFLVKDPTKSSWSLAPLNGLKTLRITKVNIRSANKEENEEPFWYYWSGRLKAVSRLWPLGQEPHILPLYGAKRRDKDDVHGVGRRRRSDVQRKVWRDLGSSGYVQVSTCSSRGTYIGVEQRTTGSTKQARSSTASESTQRPNKPEAEWRELLDDDCWHTSSSLLSGVIRLFKTPQPSNAYNKHCVGNNDGLWSRFIGASRAVLSGVLGGVIVQVSSSWMDVAFFCHHHLKPSGARRPRITGYMAVLVLVDFEPISSSDAFYNATALKLASAAITLSTNVAPSPPRLV